MRSSIRKQAAIVGVLALLIVGGLSYAGGNEKSGTWTGWITDETCGEKNANAEGKACTLKCAKNGAKLVLYVEDGKKLIGLDDQDEAIKHLGMPVTVTGTLDGGTIKVQKIEEKKG